MPANEGLIWVVTPLSRADDAGNVLANFRRQRHRNKRLIVAENGCAVGATRGLTGVHARLTTPPTAAAAKNAALLALAQERCMVAFFDSDDYYAPGYLSEAVCALRGRPVVGKNIHYVRYSDGLYYYRQRADRACRSAELLHGATISLWLQYAFPFPAMAVGEDYAWCLKARLRGLALYATSERNYIYNRVGAGHAWDVSEAVAKYGYGAAERYPCAPNSRCALRCPPLGQPYMPTEAELFTADWGGATFAAQEAPAWPN